MPKVTKKKSRLAEVNRGLELGADFVRALGSFIGALRSPQEAPPTGQPPARLTAYEVFGLPPTASQKEFKQRYRELMRLFHSDRGSGSDAMAKRINQAYSEIKQERGWK